MKRAAPGDDGPAPALAPAPASDFLSGVVLHIPDNAGIGDQRKSLMENICMKKGGTVTALIAEATHCLVGDDCDPSNVPALKDLDRARWPDIRVTGWISNCSLAKALLRDEGHHPLASAPPLA